MSRSVVIVNEDGRLVAARGDGSGEAESNRHYAKFAGRLLGEYVEQGYASSRKSALRFGWNGSGTLVVAKGSSGSEWVQGDLVDIRSEKVSISGDLSVGGHDLQDIINESLASAFDLGIKGQKGEISVSVADYEDSSGSDPYAPLKVCTIGLDATILNRIETLEREMHTSVPSSVVFGKGLLVEVEETSQSSSSDDDPTFRRNVSVRIDETTMKFTGTAGLEKIAVNTVDSPVPVSDTAAMRPVTAAGVYSFVSDSISSAFINGIKGTDGEINVSVSDNPAYGTNALLPLKICTLSLDRSILDRLEITNFGSGLLVTDETQSSDPSEPRRRNVSIRLDPNTMKFTGGPVGSEMISVDTTDTPVPSTDENADKPITASGVYNFMPKYNIEKIGERYQLKDVYDKVQEIIKKLTGES